jgi:hypothetical protein
MSSSASWMTTQRRGSTPQVRKCGSGDRDDLRQGTARSRAGEFSDNSVEEAGASGLPESWLTNQWGTNDASFQCMSTGNTGTRSVRVGLVSAGVSARTPQNAKVGEGFTLSHLLFSVVPPARIERATPGLGIGESKLVCGRLSMSQRQATSSQRASVSVGAES